MTEGLVAKQTTGIAIIVWPMTTSYTKGHPCPFIYLQHSLRTRKLWTHAWLSCASFYNITAYVSILLIKCVYLLLPYILSQVLYSFRSLNFSLSVKAKQKDVARERHLLCFSWLMPISNDQCPWVAIGWSKFWPCPLFCKEYNTWKKRKGAASFCLFCFLD